MLFRLKYFNVSKYQLLVCECYLQTFDHYSVSRNNGCVCCTEYHEALADICEYFKN